MREIKVRGKAKMSIEQLDSMHFEHENGWFIGNFIQNGDTPLIVGDLIEIDPEYIVHEFWVTVHPESVGEYTGLKDKNGTEIYEGDIVRYLDQYITSNESGMDFDEFMNVGEVFFDEEYARYDISNKNGLDYDDIFDGSDDLEVVGNIYEHSHLLEGEK